MATLTNQHNFIWYGICSYDETSPKTGSGTNESGDCLPFSLNDSGVKTAWYINESNQKKSWVQGAGNNDFIELVCGNAYYISLNKDTEPITSVEIPHAVISTENYKIAECEAPIDNSPLVIDNLWISFAKVDPQAWYFSDFLEVRGAEAENINRYEVTGSVKGFNQYNKDADGNGLIQNGTKFDKTKHIDGDNYNPFASDPFNFIEEYFSTYEDMINAFHDTVVFTGEGDIGGRNEKWYIDFVTEFDYTKFKIIDEKFNAENFTFDKTISHAFLVKSSTKPPFQVGTTNNTFETSFNAVGEISLKCDDTWNYDAETKTNLIFLGNKEHKFTDVWSTEDDATQSGLTDKTDAMQTPWLGGKMSLSANGGNIIDSKLQTNNVFSIKEFYFQKVGQDSPIKFGDGNPKGSHCE